MCLLHIVAKHILFFSFKGIIHMCCGGLECCLVLLPPLSRDDIHVLCMDVLECLLGIIAKHILCLRIMGIIQMCRGKRSVC